ncbi:MAG: ATP-dependent RecD-like DNA helicase, partial [Deltaproteobacteria bacterium]|nr:ATP-dependent RecD-like DNA helicase [Deltaproteobacteria bacterium]
MKKASESLPEGRPLLTEQAAQVEFEGTLERVLFHNDENGYSVLRIKPHGKADPCTTVGVMPSPQVGVGVRLAGAWAEHPRFGRQFQFSSYDILLPATAEGIRHYLGSGLIKGIRQAMAKRIVERFGDEALRILDEEPERLSEVKGITIKMIKAISSSWEEHKNIRSLIMFLQPHDISTSYAVRIFRHYGADALDTVRENPYRLAMDIHGIGFVTADMLARKLGVEHDSPLRAEAGVLYALRGLNDEGHVYYPLDDLLTKSMSELELEEENVRAALKSLELSDRVILEDLYDHQGDFLHTAVYLTISYHCEQGIAQYLNRLINSPKSDYFAEEEAFLNYALSKSTVDLGRGQVEAVRASLRGKVLVITGGPGTGKTTVINAIIKVFEKVKSKILLAAPTGRAAKRMTETSGREARTIHRLLEYSPGEDGFARNENNPLACGLLVVDEASMLDSILMFQLLKAVPLGATVVLVGDVNQLPSVGAGNVLRDIMASDRVPVIELMEIFRQAAESSIILSAHRVNQGLVPMPSPDDGTLSDFYFIRQEDPDKCADMVVDLVRSHIPRRFKLHPVDEIQVLSPMHKGAAGAAALNIRLQQALNGQSVGLRRGERHFCLDDKVMQIKNNYEKDVYNGDIGRICHVDTEENEITVRFDDNKNVLYSREELDELVPAYAISVHKSQGSEYPAVVIPLLTQHY